MKLDLNQSGLLLSVLNKMVLTRRCKKPKLHINNTKWNPQWLWIQWIILHDSCQMQTFPPMLSGAVCCLIVLKSRLNLYTRHVKNVHPHKSYHTKLPFNCIKQLMRLMIIILLNMWHSLATLYVWKAVKAWSHKE